MDLAKGFTPPIWVNQGGLSTLKNIESRNLNDSEKRKLVIGPYVIEGDDFFLTHGGPGLFFGEDDLRNISHIKREIIEYDEDNWQEWLNNSTGYISRKLSIMRKM